MEVAQNQAFGTNQGRTRRRLYYWLGAIVLLVLVAAAAAGPIMSRVEQPDYQIEASNGGIEIRAYGPMIAAQAVVEGERKAAISEGFRLIAAYIFGANKPNAKIAMTAPVQQQRQTIAMTAPVTQQVSGNAWTVRFHHAESVDPRDAAGTGRRAREPEAHISAPLRCADLLWSCNRWRDPEEN